MVIDMANSRLSILDSLRKEQTEYQDMIDIIQGYFGLSSNYIYPDLLTATIIKGQIIFLFYWA